MAIIKCNNSQSMINILYINEATKEQVFSKEQVAKILKLSLSTIRMCLHKHHGKNNFIYYKCKNIYYYPQSSIDLFAKMHKENIKRTAPEYIYIGNVQYFSKRYVANILGFTVGTLTTYLYLLRQKYINNELKYFIEGLAHYYPQSTIDILKYEYKKS
jgi:hypothetical protein